MGLQFGNHAASSYGLTATNRGDLHYTRVRHAGDTQPEGFVSCKTPTISCM